MATPNGQMATPHDWMATPNGGMAPPNGRMATPHGWMTTPNGWKAATATSNKHSCLISISFVNFIREGGGARSAPQVVALNVRCPDKSSLTMQPPSTWISQQALAVAKADQAAKLYRRMILRHIARVILMSWRWARFYKDSLNVLEMGQDFTKLLRLGRSRGTRHFSFQKRLQEN